MNRNLFNSIRNEKVINEVFASIDEWGNNLDGKLLNVLHVNVCSLEKHWNSLMIDLVNVLRNLDVLVFTEINLNEEKAQCYHIHNFHQFFTCRSNRTGGGIMVFIKDCFNTETVTYNFDEAENLIIRMTHLQSKKKFTLVPIYRSPKNKLQKFIVDLTWWLSNAVKKDENLILVGDLNYYYYY